MARDSEAPVPEDLKPCPEYAMSERFRAWLVERMGAEVRKEVSATGLDRMALLKDPASRRAAFRHPRARQTKRKSA